MHWQCWQGISFLWKSFLFISNLTHQLPNFKLQQINKCIDKTSKRCNYYRWRTIFVFNLWADLTCAVVILTCFDVCVSLPPPVSAQQVRPGVFWLVTPLAAHLVPVVKTAMEWKHVSEVWSVKKWRCQFGETEYFLHRYLFLTGDYLQNIPR